MNVAPVTTVALVAAVCLALGGFITAAIVVCVVCFAFEFFFPTSATWTALDEDEASHNS